MRKVYSSLFAALLAVVMLGCGSAEPTVAAKVEVPANKVQSVQIYYADNTDGKITPESISAAFDSVGVVVPGNNNMNSPFKLRFNNTYYNTYNLAMFSNGDLTLKLIKKYPNFGALTPLTMSIWSDDEKHTMNISTLSIDGMARAGGIPVTDPDLIAYAELIKTALAKALPNGAFKTLDYTMKSPAESFAITFEATLEEDVDVTEYRENFESEFEGELEPIGFLLPNYTNLKEELFDKAGYDEYDFYVTYSICKFDVIYPVSRLHPEAGAYAPCSFYIYKKKGENKAHMGFLGVDNWITTLDIEDEESIKPLREAQGMIEKIVNEMTE
jgi:uncharacterized protein (DUF302 family)